MKLKRHELMRIDDPSQFHHKGPGHGSSYRHLASQMHRPEDWMRPMQGKRSTGQGSRTERRAASSRASASHLEEPSAVQSPHHPDGDGTQQELPTFDPRQFEQSLRSPMDVDPQPTFQPDPVLDTHLSEIVAVLPDELSLPEFQPLNFDRTSACEQPPAQATTIMDNVVPKDVLNRCRSKLEWSGLAIRLTYRAS
ncbi:MAG: hypothetical protein M1816_000005 [Peltula sp. TS41687]|nr:MAG: hypothetical protein M1816_000005 [Peltula sp. TS41687]